MYLVSGVVCCWSVCVDVSQVYHALLNVVVSVHENDAKVFVGRLNCKCLYFVESCHL